MGLLTKIIISKTILDISKSSSLNVWKYTSNTRNFSLSKERSKSTMRFVQFCRKNNPKQINVGIISESCDAIKEIQPSMNMIEFLEQEGTTNAESLKRKYDNLKPIMLSDDIKLVSPLTNPEKIICIGLNYKDHCEEQNKPFPTEPIFFSKFTNSITGPTGNVIAHSVTNKIDWEVELVVVIGKKAHNISKEDVNDYIFGYTIANDISARDWLKDRNGGQYLIGKSMDTFCPLGPSITHKSLIRDPQNLSLTCKINGVVKQCGNTGNMIYKINDIISRLSRVFTLKPGDIVLTGTPAGVGAHRSPPEFLKPGDVIESEIESIGKIVNRVISE